MPVSDNHISRQTSEHSPVSSSIQEIISARPGPFVRRGTAVICTVLLLLVTSMWFVRYPDTLEGAAVITTDPPPVMLQYNTGGRLSGLFARENDMLLSAQPIAELENYTGYENVLLLQDYAANVLHALRLNDIAQLDSLSGKPWSSLGDAQSIFNSLSDALAAYVLRHRQGAFAGRDANLRSQRSSYRALTAASRAEGRLINDNLIQASERYRANEQLFKDKVISRLEYYDEAQRLRGMQMTLKRQNSEMMQHQVALTNTDKQMLDLHFDQADKISLQRLSIVAEVHNLQNFIQTWRMKYLLSAPHAGRLHYLQPIQPGANVSAGEALCAVIPATCRYTAFIGMPAYGLGKVRAGQEVQLSSDLFPAKEYGYLTGRVSHIAALPTAGKDGSYYRVSVALPDTLLSSFGKRLPFSPEMAAKARIITLDRSMIQRLFSSIAGSW